MTHVIAVLNDKQRHDMIRKAVENYKIKFMDKNSVKIIQDRINRICIYDNDYLIHSIVFVIAPVIFNWDNIECLSSDNTKYSFGIIFEEIDKIKHKLKDLIDNPGKHNKKRTELNELLNKITI